MFAATEQTPFIAGSGVNAPTEAPGERRDQHHAGVRNDPLIIKRDL